MHIPLHAILQLTTRHALFAIATFGLASHCIFRRREPVNAIVLVALLVLLPAIFSLLLAPHYSVAKAIALSFITYFSTLFTSILAYRVSPFHPLAQYPGPLACKVSAFWMAWVAKTGKRHLYMQRLHDQYGDVVRTGPNELFIRDPAVIIPMLGSAGLPKGPGMAGRNLHQPILPLIAIMDPIEHARRRKPWNRAFSTAALKEYQPIVTRRTAQLIEGLMGEVGTTDLAKWISYYAYDFMGDMVFGGGTEMLREGDRDGLWRLLKNGMSIAVIYEHVPWLSYYTRHLPGLGNDLKRLRAMAFERTIQRYNRGSLTKDLFYYLSNEDQAETESPPRHIVISDGLIALIAGSDTTATTLSNVFYCLLTHPETYKRLQDEVDKYYPLGEDALNPEHHVHMTYLDAVINETMRLFPAVSSGSLRAPIRGTGGKTVGPYYLPEGTQARLHVYSLQRDARYFTQPESFWPDRWLIAEGLQKFSGQFVHDPNAFIPFSFGTANCVGKNLAMLEMRMVMCNCMQKLEMNFAEGWDSEMWLRDLEDVFVTRMGQLPVTIRKRE